MQCDLTGHKWYYNSPCVAEWMFYSMWFVSLLAGNHLSCGEVQCHDSLCLLPSLLQLSATLRAATIEQEDCLKLLGINIDKKLDFKFQVNEVCRKVGGQLNALRRQSRLLNIQSKMKVFNAFIRANINYCPLVCINRNRTDLARIEKVQE